MVQIQKIDNSKNEVYNGIGKIVRDFMTLYGCIIPHSNILIANMTNAFNTSLKANVLNFVPRLVDSYRSAVLKCIDEINKEHDGKFNDVLNQCASAIIRIEVKENGKEGNK